MIEVAKRHEIELTFFHGKGGTVGRGGNPALYEAILAHPPGTINGRFRVTEQGEMITQNLGEESVAERTLGKLQNSNLFLSVLGNMFSRFNKGHFLTLFFVVFWFLQTCSRPEYSPRASLLAPR